MCQKCFTSVISVTLICPFAASIFTFFLAYILVFTEFGRGCTCSIHAILWFQCFSMAHKTRKPRVTSYHVTSYNSCHIE